MELLEEDDKDGSRMGGGGVYPRLSYNEAGHLVDAGDGARGPKPRARYMDCLVAAPAIFILRHSLDG